MEMSAATTFPALRDYVLPLQRSFGVSIHGWDNTHFHFNGIQALAFDVKNANRKHPLILVQEGIKAFVSTGCKASRFFKFSGLVAHIHFYNLSQVKQGRQKQSWVHWNCHSNMHECVWSLWWAAWEEHSALWLLAVALFFISRVVAFLTQAYYTLCRWKLNTSTVGICIVCPQLQSSSSANI